MTGQGITSDILAEFAKAVVTALGTKLGEAIGLATARRLGWADEADQQQEGEADEEE